MSIGKDIAQAFAYSHKSRLKLKGGKVILKANQSIPESITTALRKYRAEVVAHLETERAHWIDILVDHQKWLTDNYDDYFLNETKEFVYRLEDFSTVEKLLEFYFDYGSSCINEGVCPSNAPLCCKYCSDNNKWSNNNESENRPNEKENIISLS